MKYLKEINNKDFKLNRKERLKHLILIFIIGAFIGYLYEFILYFIDLKTPYNPGFLYGPYLPVYGFGAIFLEVLLDNKKAKKNPLLVFILGFIITGIVEYLTGYLLEMIYHRSWWDYSNAFLNINGYICLRSLTIFASAGVLLVYIISPIIKSIISKTKQSIINNIITIYIIVIIIDTILTLSIRYK